MKTTYRIAPTLLCALQMLAMMPGATAQRDGTIHPGDAMLDPQQAFRDVVQAQAAYVAQMRSIEMTTSEEYFMRGGAVVHETFQAQLAVEGRRFFFQIDGEQHGQPWGERSSFDGEKYMAAYVRTRTIEFSSQPINALQPMGHGNVLQAMLGSWTPKLGKENSLRVLLSPEYWDDVTSGPRKLMSAKTVSWQGTPAIEITFQNTYSPSVTSTGSLIVAKDKGLFPVRYSEQYGSQGESISSYELVRHEVIASDGIEIIVPTEVAFKRLQNDQLELHLLLRVEPNSLRINMPIDAKRFSISLEPPAGWITQNADSSEILTTGPQLAQWKEWMDKTNPVAARGTTGLANPVTQASILRAAKSWQWPIGAAVLALGLWLVFWRRCRRLNAATSHDDQSRK